MGVEDLGFPKIRSTPLGFPNTRFYYCGGGGGGVYVGVPCL